MKISKDGAQKTAYKVRLEFDVDSIDFADVEVTATTREEAIEAAIKAYRNAPEILDFYSSNTYESTLRSEDSEEWLIEEIQDEDK